VTLRSVAVAEVVAASRAGAGFGAVIDVRSPAEFAEDHLPGAVNWPVLDDEQRRVVGTLYVQDSPLAARKIGAALVARNIAAHIDRWVRDRPREWQPLVYCWRGGQRSLALAWFLDQIGFRTARLNGGYKAYRALVRDELSTLPLGFRFTVLAGRTGSGKTRLLHALHEQGAQVLDLEALASHRGSVLGGWPDRPQPSQKRFDSLLWQALRGFDAQRPVFVESESRRIGSLQLPDALLAQMREHASCLLVQMDDGARVQLLLQEYGWFAGQPERFCELLGALTELQGKERVNRWRAMAQAAQWPELFGELMREHYDPLYERSMRRNFAGLAHAQRVALADGTQATVRAAARELLRAA
jgi:tRNA 2-selenouridine synthase